MTTGEPYNGWRGGYSTWAIALWLGSDPATDAAARFIVATWNEESAEYGGTLSNLADALRELVESLPEVEAVQGTASLTADLLGFALDSADWLELAESFAADLLGDGAEAELERRRSLYLEGIRTSV